MEEDITKENRERGHDQIHWNDAAVAPDGPLVRYEDSHPAMGTMFSIIAYGASSISLEDAVDRAFEEIDRLDSLMSHYKPDSEICAINREAYRQPVVVAPELFNLLQDSFRYSEDTGGAFDITVGPLMKAWGFFRGWGRLPDQAELEQALKRIGYQHVRLDAATRTLAFDQAGVELDLGAIGKGYAVDRAVETLRAAGVTCALVSSGTSSIYALGSPPGEHGWEISVCDPMDRRKQACSLRLQNLSISISGDYEQSFVLGGKLYTHILNPRTGCPVENMLMTVVVAASNAASDALSTAFFVAGLERSRGFLEHHPDLDAIFYQPGSSSRSFEQTVLRSSVTHLPADRLMRM